MSLPSIQKTSAQDAAQQVSERSNLPTRKLNVLEAARFLGLSVSTLNKMRVRFLGINCLDRLGEESLDRTPFESGNR